MNKEYILNSLMIFSIMVIVDVIWTLYLSSVQNNKPFSAGLCSIFIYLTSAITTTKWVENKNYILPALVGAFLGTYLVVKYKK